MSTKKGQKDFHLTSETFTGRSPATDVGFAAKTDHSAGAGAAANAAIPPV
jgi:hypothetical protein